MSSPATIDDLARRSLRPLTDDEKRVGEGWLEDAWAMLVIQRPYLAIAADRDRLVAAVVVQVLCAMVMRVINNPEGKYQESGDDYSYSRDSAVSTGALYVSADELALLPAGERRRRTSFTIVPS